jgi:hypothetical protein
LTHIQERRSPRHIFTIFTRLLWFRNIGKKMHNGTKNIVYKFHVPQPVWRYATLHPIRVLNISNSIRVVLSVSWLLKLIIVINVP